MCVHSMNEDLWIAEQPSQIVSADPVHSVDDRKGRRAKKVKGNQNVRACVRLRERGTVSDRSRVKKEVERSPARTVRGEKRQSERRMNRETCGGGGGERGGERLCVSVCVCLCMCV